MKHTFLFLLFASAFLANAQNNPPVANDDTIITISGGSSPIKNVVANDSDPDGNQISIDTVLYYSGKGTIQKLGYSPPYKVVRYTADSSFWGTDTAWYVVCDDGTPSLCDTAMIIINVNFQLYPAYAQIDINNINARINCDGSQFWDLKDLPKFEIPKGDSTTSLFNAAMWIGGKDSSNLLHLAATRFNSSGKDFFPGPIMDSANYSFNQDTLWNKTWKINRSEINYHLANWNQSGYIIPPSFLTWPAHGDTSLGQAYYLAPFNDNNYDGKYNAADGDCPNIKGDQAVYCILNDERDIHTETGGEKMKIEVHLMAYEFDCNVDSALWNTLFLNYRIINRSGNTYDSTYIGFWTDGDLGCANDDYVACDVQRGSYYFYNGDEMDEDCLGAFGYGNAPPAQSVTFLGGPKQDDDGSDNPLIYDYNTAIANGGIPYSGLGFGYGDTIVDNERIGMATFRYFNNCGGGPTCDPTVASEYYNYLNDKWSDNSQMVYGGNAHINGCPGTGPGSGTFTCVPAKYMFPDITDPLGWGTDGVQQSPWNEVNSGNTPSDRRGIASAGPFTFKPNDVQELDIAFVFGRDYDSTTNASIAVMRQRIDAVREMFFNDSTTCGGQFSYGISERSVANDEIVVYPNPTNGKLEIRNWNIGTIEIFNILGEKVFHSPTHSFTHLLIDLSSQPPGIYILKISHGEKNYTKKIVKE